MRRLLDYGERGALLECADLAETLGLLRTLHDAGFDDILEMVPGAETIFLRLARPLTRQRRHELRELEPTVVDTDAAEEVIITVSYDGEDLTEVARHCGLSPDEVVAAHIGQTWRVGFCGFAPGFGYLHGEDDRLRVPRRTEPRTAVPAGAVGLADVWTGIYPRRGPGGWQLIGRTEQPMWDLGRDPPALLQPGSSVRFVDQQAPAATAGGSR